MSGSPDKFEDDPKAVSRLQLDRFASGELTGADRSATQAWLGQNARGFQHLESLKDARRATPPLDIGALRARAGGLLAIDGAATQATSAETFPPGMLDGRDLLAKVQSALQHDAEAAATPTDAPQRESDVDRSTVPFAEERANGPSQDQVGHIDEQHTPQPQLARKTPRGEPTGTNAVAKPAVPAPANRPLWHYVILPLLTVAAVAAFMLRPAPTSDTSDLRLRGASALEVRELTGGAMRAWDGHPLGGSDVVGFAIAPGSHKSVVVVSVDALGHVSQWYPVIGESTAIPGAGGADHAASVPLDGSVTLDDTPGEEVFVAAFDTTPDAVIGDVTAQYQSGGTKGVATWAEAAPDADAVVVGKK